MMKLTPARCALRASPSLGHVGTSKAAAGPIPQQSVNSITRDSVRERNWTSLDLAVLANASSPENLLELGGIRDDNDDTLLCL